MKLITIMQIIIISLLTMLGWLRIIVLFKYAIVLALCAICYKRVCIVSVFGQCALTYKRGEGERSKRPIKVMGTISSLYKGKC